MKKIISPFTILAISAFFLLVSCGTQKEINRATAVHAEIQALRDLNNDKMEKGTQSPEIGKSIDSTYEKMQNEIQ